MNLEQTDRVKDLIVQVSKFMDDHIWPAEEIYASQMDSFREEGNPWRVPPVIEELKTKAKAQGLWNFFLSKKKGRIIAPLVIFPNSLIRRESS